MRTVLLFLHMREKTKQTNENNDIVVNINDPVINNQADMDTLIEEFVRKLRKVQMTMA